jgi:hypothetical protein
MYSNLRMGSEDVVVAKIKKGKTRVQQERDRRMNAIDLTNTVVNDILSETPIITAAEEVSMLFRQRGIPCMDYFTALVLARFRSGLGHVPETNGDERKFMPLLKWECDDVTGTLWTIEPVVSSFIMRGNDTNCEMALNKYKDELVVLEAMSMSSHSTTVKPDNELWGRWAGWILWRDSVDNGGFTNSVCVNCNVSSFLFAFSCQTTDTSLIHLAMTPATIELMTGYAKKMCMSLSVTVSATSNESTKLIIQPSMARGTGTSLRFFGNGSVQICGSPNDIESLTKAAFAIVRETLEKDTAQFLSSMRQMRQQRA